MYDLDIMQDITKEQRQTLSEKSFEIKAEYDMEAEYDFCTLGTLFLSDKVYRSENSLSYRSTPSEHLDNILAELKVDNKRDAFIFSVYKYEHSGIALSFSEFTCKFDSCLAGYMAVSKKQVREWYDVKKITKNIREELIKTLTQELEIFEHYLNGEVYTGELVCKQTGIVIESVGGFCSIDSLIECFIDIAKNTPKTQVFQFIFKPNLMGYSTSA